MFIRTYFTSALCIYIFMAYFASIAVGINLLKCLSALFRPPAFSQCSSIILQAIQFVCILRFVELSNHLSGSGSDVVESLRLSKISLLWYCFPGRREVDLVEYQIWIDENLFEIIELRWRDDGWARKQNIHQESPGIKRSFHCRAIKSVHTPENLGPDGK